MTGEAYRQVVEIFDRLRDLPEGEVTAALEPACAGHPELRDEVLRMLAADRAAEGSFLDRPVLEDAASLIGTLRLADHQAIAEATGGEFIDRYQLVKLIGSGGMGEVWLAEQHEPVRRRVALKMIRPGMNTREVITRFESERQVLAMMDHRAIAKVLDAGSTPRGAPYFVMEFVDGVPLTTFCDRQKLSIPERFALFQQVCEGVQHAHQKAIIHRDLKPSNILVAEVEGQPYPKIIDFGVAKALAPDGNGEVTMAGIILGTPNYMSPEQAGQAAHDIDTRSDIYSLGVILYELLVGVTPLELAERPLNEFLQSLLKADTPKPSVRAHELGAGKLAEVAAARGASADELVRMVRGDLDCIVLKALDKDRSRRYSSPNELAADIGRHLKDEPVIAAPPTTVYLALKFVRRHRLSLATVLAFILVLVTATAVSIHERLRADAEAATAQAVNDFLRNDLLAQASTTTQAQTRARPDLGLTVRTALDRAAQRIGGRFDNHPDVEARIRETIGQSYEDLGLYNEAYEQFRRVLNLLRRLPGFRDQDGVRALDHVAKILMLLGKYDEAGTDFREAVEAGRRILGTDHPQTLRAINGLAANYGMQSRLDLAEPLFQEAYEKQTRVQGREHSDTLTTLNNLATVLMRRGKYRDAEPLFRSLLEIRLRVLGPDHPQTLVTLSHLAETYIGEGRYADAEATESPALEVRKRVLGTENSFTLISMANLGTIYRHLGRFSDAEKILSETLNIQRRTIGPEHVETLGVMSSLADVYSCLGEYKRAEALLKETIGTSHRIRGAEDPVTCNALTRFAVSLTGQRRYADAESILTTNFEAERRVFGPDHENTLEALAALVRLKGRQHNFESAKSAAQQLLNARHKTLGDGHPDTATAILYLGETEYSLSEFQRSEALAGQALTQCTKNWPESWLRYRAEGLLAASLSKQGKRSERNQHSTAYADMPAFELALSALTP